MLGVLVRDERSIAMSRQSIKVQVQEVWRNGQTRACVVNINVGNCYRWKSHKARHCIKIISLVSLIYTMLNGWSPAQAAAVKVI